MNILILTEIKDAHSKMSAYAALLNYRYMNLCVKAEVASLLAITVETELGRDNLEDVAFVSQPSEYELAIYPKHKMFLENIVKGVFDVHPEFKMEMKLIEDKNGEELLYPLYTMPSVDKNRRDLLNAAAESFYQDTKTRIEKVNADFQVKLSDLSTKLQKEDLDEVEKEYDEGYQQQKDAIAKLLQDKQNEIGEAYQRYLMEHSDDGWPNNSEEEADDSSDQDSGYNVSQSFKMGEMIQ